MSQQDPNVIEAKPRRRWLRWVLLVFLLMAVFALAVPYLVLRGSLPRTSGSLVAAGLQHTTVIHFDELERPYVEAKTLPDALYAQGFLHASHRLWQMELFRRAGQGRLAELLGPSMLDADQDLFRCGVPQFAEILRQNSSPKLRERIEAYVNGVNTGIRSLSVRPTEFLLLGTEVKPWTENDVFAVGSLMAYQSANNQMNELLRLELSQTLDAERFNAFLTDSSEESGFPFVLPPSPNSEASVSPPSEPSSDASSSYSVGHVFESLAELDPAENPRMPRLGFGSNGWVVAPSKSKSGHALFAFDSHDELGLPNLFYEVNLFYGDGKQIRGWSVAGLPGVINGYNHRIAWGFTNIGDTQDLFLETRNPDDPSQFKDGDAWYTAHSESVEIPVAGRPNADSFTIVSTKNGPLISDDPPIALRWTVHDVEAGGPGLDGFFNLNLAENWEDFNAALNELAAPSLNATYADVDGNIGFRTGGILPIRSHGKGLYPLEGSDESNRWKGQVSLEDMPRSFNPDSGYLAAANARVNAEGDGPLVSADNAAPYRIHRIQQVLEDRDDLTLEDMQQLQFDWHDSQAERLMPVMLEALNQSEHQREETSNSSSQAVELLQKWHSAPVATADSAAALIFQLWYLELAREVFVESLGDELYARLTKRNYVLNHALDRLLRFDQDSLWWQGDRHAVITRAWERTLERLTEELGPDPTTWRLDHMQSVALGHELGKAEPMLAPLFNLEATPWAGGPAMVGRANYRYDRPFQVSHGATVRVTAEMSASPQVHAVIPGGQSGHPLSAHYADQFNAWLNGEQYPVQESPNEVSGKTLTLTPE